MSSPVRPEGRTERPTADRPTAEKRWAATAWVLSLGGLAATLLTVGADLGYGFFTADADGRDVGAALSAFAYLAAMLAPLPMALALALASARLLARTTPWMATAVGPFSSRRALFHRDPPAFRATLGAAFSLGATFLVYRTLAHHFATRYHDAQLAAAAMATAALLWLPLAGLLAAALGHILAPLDRWLGPFASAGSALAVVAGCATAVVLRLAPAAASLSALGGARALALGAGTLLAYLVACWAVSRRRWRRPLRSLVALWLAVAGGLFLAATGYGHGHRVRAVIERDTSLGLPLVRTYRGLADRDGDGFAFAFGGEDCDDSDAAIHPGAADEPGDGVDSDCFAGDGTPALDTLGDGSYAERPAALDPHPNILFISVDALRPDHLGFSGYTRETSPRMDAFLAEAVNFDDAVATSTRTMLSVPSLFTGLYPSEVAYGHEYLWPSVAESNDTLAESLRRAGYSTAAIMGTNYLQRARGFFQGFARALQAPSYHPARGWTADHAVTELRRLAAAHRPFFLWAHLFNVHEPYLRDHRDSRFGPGPMAAYDTEIRYADDDVGRLLDVLDELELADDTIVVLASDHGEAFGEHGEFHHANALYDEELRVVLALRVPGVPPRRVTETVGLHDLTPTLLNLADVQMPGPTPALSLVRLFDAEGGLEPHRLLFGELMPDGRQAYDQKTVRRDGMKLIWWVQDGSYALFDLHQDPGELDDLSDERPEVARELLGLLRAWVALRALPQNRTDELVAAARLEREPDDLTQRLDVTLPGHFTLLGVSAPTTRYRAGTPVAFDLVYHVDQETTDDLNFHIKVVGPPGYRMPPHVDAYHLPLSGRYRSTQWQTGEILRDPVRIALPTNLRHPIELKLRLEVRQGRRVLPFADGRTEIPLAQISVR